MEVNVPADAVEQALLDRMRQKRLTLDREYRIAEVIRVLGLTEAETRRMMDAHNPRRTTGAVRGYGHRRIRYPALLAMWREVLRANSAESDNSDKSAESAGERPPYGRAARTRAAASRSRTPA